MMLSNRLTSGVLITVLFLIIGYIAVFVLNRQFIGLSATFWFGGQDTYGSQNGSLALNQERKLSEMPTLSQLAITTSSGLQYDETLIGEGKQAKRGDLLLLHYTGFLSDGIPFESSIPYHEPQFFALGATPMRGWDEGLIGMRVGGQRTLRIPPHLAYGEQGWVGVPPHSTLVYDMQLLAIEAPPQPARVSKYSMRESGVESAILETGNGKAVQKGDLVEFEYHAWVENDILFNSSLLDGFPSILPVGQTGLAGLDEGLLGMKIGETRQLRIPPALAYGENGAEGVIPPDATLIFEIALLDNKEKPLMQPLDEHAYTSTPNGVQLATLQEGKGASANFGDQVLIHYHAWYADGTFFDSSHLTNIPHRFILGQGMVIPGWDDGIYGMKVGETRQLRIPPALSVGAPPIPPALDVNTPLIFEIELLELQTSEILAVNQE